MTIKAVILDSGNVLVRPRLGVWFPPPSFESVVDERHPGWDRTNLTAALDAGYTWLDEVHSTPLRDEDEELVVMQRYYELVLAGLGIGADDGAADTALAIVAAEVAEPPVEPYEWTEEVLAELHDRGLPVVILSNAWPSLRRFFRQLGLDRWVSAMVISAEHGITKPDHRLYRAAIDLTGCTAADAVFVDDWHDNVRAANELGLRGIRLLHPEEEPAPDLHEIRDLRELLTLLDDQVS
jgi:putative hydrolase of the HAD superfamily